MPVSTKVPAAELKIKPQTGTKASTIHGNSRPMFSRSRAKHELQYIRSNIPPIQGLEPDKRILPLLHPDSRGGIYAAYREPE